MKWSVGKKIGAGFALAIVVMAFLGVKSYLALNDMIEAAQWRARTYEVMVGLNTVFSNLQDAETGQRGYLITGDDSYLAPYNAALEQINPSIADIQTKTTDSLVQSQIIDLKVKVAEKLAALKEAIAVRREEGFEMARDVVITDKGKKAMGEIRALVAEMNSQLELLMNQRNSKLEIDTRNVKLTIVVGVSAAMLLLALSGLLISRNIARPLNFVSNVASRAAAGDLAIEVPALERSDEVGVLSKSFRLMVESLRTSMAGISEGISVLGASASEILASTTQVASGTAETASSISETTTTVEEVRQAARLSSDKAKTVADNAKRLTQVAQAGQNAVEETAAGIMQIRTQMESVAETIVRLSEQSQTIGGIIASVTDLADQSNLLAVNAAIEAARAGEHGKGFSVVAQEIRSLADQSRLATIQVREILSDVQKATTAAVMATEQGSKAVDAGVEQSARAGDAIRELAASAGNAANSAIQIVSSSEQQVIGMDQIGIAMESISLASTQTASSMQQSEAAARNLHELGQRLKQLVEQYRT